MIIVEQGSDRIISIKTASGEVRREDMREMVQSDGRVILSTGDCNNEVKTVVGNENF